MADFVHASGCGCCCVSRRRFIAHGCAACAGAAAGLSVLRSTSLGATAGDKVKIRLVFSHCLPEEITWPNIGYDYESHKRQVLAQLQQACPQIEFLPVWARTNEDADKIYEADKEVAGYIVYMAGMKGSGNQLLAKLGPAGTPRGGRRSRLCRHRQLLPGPGPDPGEPVEGGPYFESAIQRSDRRGPLLRDTEETGQHRGRLLQCRGSRAAKKTSPRRATWPASPTRSNCVPSARFSRS